MLISDTVFLYLYLAAVFLLAGGAVVFIFWRRLAKRDEVWRSLNLRLFKVTLPRARAPEGGLALAQIREGIAAMEKVFANLQSVRASGWRSWVSGQPSFALELTVPHLGEEISFYIAVPRKLAGSVEKAIEGVFPEARVLPAPDYNIFNPDGRTAAAALALRRDSILPIRTYRDLETDPLAEITSALSKLAAIGEGAAFQIVARPAPRVWTNRILSHARLVREGKARLIPKGAIGQGFGLAGDILTTVQPGKEKSGETPPRALTPSEDEGLKRLERKGSSPLFEVNMRLVTSAVGEPRAHEILDGMAAAFLQFRDPTMNEIGVSPVVSRRLSRFLYAFSFRVFDPAAAAVFSAEELASFFHFPNVPLETPKVAAVKFREAPPPPNLPAEGLALGSSVFRGETRTVRIAADDRRRHLYTIGQTGTGKSALLLGMIRQDILSGRGVCFIDPHGEAVGEILGYVPAERARDVIYFDPADAERPMGLNMLEYDHARPETKTLVVNELFAIFQKLYGAVPEALGPMFEQYFRNAALLAMEDPDSGSTLLEVGRIFTDIGFRARKLARSTNVVVSTFWREIAAKAGGESSLANVAPYVTSKFDTFLANDIMRPLVAQERSAFDFRRVMDEGKILLVNLSKGRLGETNAALIGLIIVGKLLLAALSRADAPEGERREFHVYLDEFQSVTTPSIATILSEARKYRLDLTLAHQFIGQLDEAIKKAVFGNVGSMVAFRVGADDAEFVAQQFAPVFSASDLMNLDNYNACLRLLIGGQTALPFNIKTDAPPKGNAELADAARQFSRMTYGRPRAVVEAEINRRYQEAAPSP